MKASPDSKATKASRKCSQKTGSTAAKNCTKRTKRVNHKPRGCGEELLDDKENQHFPSKESVRLCPELPDKDTFLVEKRETLELHSRQTVTSSAKIKLQLFPINKETRIGLEKDGHNPYLELTLRGQKKISSVLKHLEKKWGSSSIAKGDPILFPYNIMENLSDCMRWTVNDSHTTAAAVYAAVGSPAVFQLKYGWFYIHEPQSFRIPSTPIPKEPCAYPGGTEVGCNATLETLYAERDKFEFTSKEFKVMGNTANEVVGQKMANASVDPLDNEQRVSGSFEQPLLSWIDGLTNISIGGLLSEESLQGRSSALVPKSFRSNIDLCNGSLPTEAPSHGRSSTLDPKSSGSNLDITSRALPSEAPSQGRCCIPDPKSFGSSLDISIGALLSVESLQGRFSTPDPKSFDSSVAMQPSQIISESLDAYITAQFTCPPFPTVPAGDLRTSILDAEETCHAFPLRKLSSPAVTASGNNNSVACSVDPSSNSLKLPNTDKVTDQDGMSQNPPSGKTQTGLSLASCLHDDEKSLGLTDIKWNDNTLGPFDLAYQAKKLFGGDSASIGGFVK